MPTPIPDPHPASEAIIEIVRVGAVLRATAMDPATLTEVIVVGPLDAGEELLRRTALSKLAYVLRRQAGAAPGEPAATAPAGRPAGAPVPVSVPTYGPTGSLRKIR